MGKYDIIVVDPPWPVKKIKRKSRPKQVAMDYLTMSVDDIATLPVAELAARDCWCFLWTTHKYLPQAFDILKKWGFKYQRTMTWDKQNGMCLFGFHHRTEFVLVGYIGYVEMYPKQRAVPTIFTESSWGAHSVKPECFYRLIEDLGMMRIDIFARKKRPGWHAWGNEVESDVEWAKSFMRKELKNGIVD
jgi:N6-adenosine-specific RNA methylase IME4